MEIEPQII